jgi:guanylate kinase
MAGKLIILSAPSGSGKSTILDFLMRQDNLCLTFSVSCTSRPPRGTERNGVEYYFLSPDEFRAKIAAGEFLEYEEVYQDRYYGTLRSEVDDRLARGENVVFDIDVAGVCSLKEIYGERALLMFIMPPSIKELRHRLESRGTDTPQVIADRIDKASYELSFKDKYDVVVVNEDLGRAQTEALQHIHDFL